jgi:hypothetical protein
MIIVPPQMLPSFDIGRGYSLRNVPGLRDFMHLFAVGDVGMLPGILVLTNEIEVKRLVESEPVEIIMEGMFTVRCEMPGRVTSLMIEGTFTVRI